MPRKAQTPPPPAAELDKGGRPSKYLPQFAIAAAKLCKLGATDRDLAEAFDVAECTVRAWRREHEEFAAALALGKEEADTRVERSLYARANGYSYDSEKVFCNKDGEVTRVPVVEHCPPDTVACIFWLKNRKPINWRDKLDIDATMRPAQLTDKVLTPDEWDRQYAASLIARSN